MKPLHRSGPGRKTYQALKSLSFRRFLRLGAFIDDFRPKISISIFGVGELEGIDLLLFYQLRRSRMEEFTDNGLVLSGSISLGLSKASYEPSFGQHTVVGRDLKRGNWVAQSFYRSSMA